MSGVESLLRNSMEGLGKDLKAHHETVRNHLAQSKTHTATSCALVSRGEQIATAAGEEAIQLAKTWASKAGAACDTIESAQAASNEATRKVEAVGTDSVDEMVCSINQMQEVQESAQAKWAASR